MILMETDATPMHIGALLLLQTGTSSRQTLAGRLRNHLAARLAGTPLQSVLRQAPNGYDSDVWVDIADRDVRIDEQVVTIDEPMSRKGLLEFVAARSIERLDLTRPPFRLFIVVDVAVDVDLSVDDASPAGGRLSAMFLQMHHSVADGVGFQRVLSLLGDETAPADPRSESAIVPDDDRWLGEAERRFDAEEPRRAAHRLRMDEALAVLKGGTLAGRAHTPAMHLSGPTSPSRSYETLSLPLDRVKTLAARLQATINDIFLAFAASALRQYLLDVDDLPDTPIVINSARSYRRPEHGEFGNRIVALHPHLGTHLADPIERLRALQASMAAERVRTPYDEAMLDAPERPFGARDRRAKFAVRPAGVAVLPGNITLSNVPGPAHQQSFAGHRLLANYPTPLLGSGRFLNITSRRQGDSLDLGIAADPTKIADIAAVKRLLFAALQDYEQRAAT